MRPQEPFEKLNGLPLTGFWQLTILDEVGGDRGWVEVVEMYNDGQMSGLFFSGGKYMETFYILMFWEKSAC